MTSWSPGVRRSPAFRFRPNGPSWDQPFLRRLAERLSGFPAGFALLIETSGSDDPRVTPGSPELESAVELAADGLPGVLERIDPTRGAPVDRSSEEQFAVVSPREPSLREPRSVERLRRPAPPLESEQLRPWRPEEAEPLEGSAAWVGAAQWHWFSSGGMDLAVRVRVRATAPLRRGVSELANAAAQVCEQLPDGHPPVHVASMSASWRRRRSWASGSLRGFWKGTPFCLTPSEAAHAVRPRRPKPTLDDRTLARHVVAIGASGSGKSSFLARLACDRIALGRATVVLDVHGDLGPAISAGLDVTSRARLAAVDVTRPVEEIPGVALFQSVRPDDRERESAHLVASLRHLSHDGSEVYWGNRLEQVFDVFVRLVEEEHGGFADLFELLSNPARRDAARATTRRPVAARFLDELPALLRRNPEYLQPALARVQKVTLNPKLTRLLDASERPLDVGRILEDGGSVIFRIPSAELGAAASRFAATLLASRTYLATSARRRREEGLRVLAIFDEAHSISPSLLAEILSEGRKFGFGAAIATQYAGRLAPEALAAAEGAAGTHLVFHVPRSAAASAGRWAGLGREDAERILPALPPGVALVDAALSAGPRSLWHIPPPKNDGGAAWEADARRAASEHGGIPGDALEPGWGSSEEAILLGIFGLESQACSPTPSEVLDAAQRIVPGFDRVELAARLPGLVQRGWAEEEEGTYRLTSAGARRLGVGAPSGAVREGDEHRALVIAALRIFARQGEWLELVRQGRFDTRLPDGLVRLLPGGIGRMTPQELLKEASRRSRRWVWRAFGGRNVHVEAEVSGAERPERIRRGLEKARASGASVLFLVADARRARRVREVLRREGAGPPEAQVWTLPVARTIVRNPQGPRVP